MKIVLTALSLLLAISLNAQQTKKQEARQKANKAVELMDNGKMDESIDILKECIKLDPDEFDYPYELSYAYYLKGEYKTTIKILEKHKKHPDLTAALFQMLGNAYDMAGKPDKAIETYDEGLLKFPNSGSLYLEKGNICYGKEQYNEALDLYEKGIEVDPTFPSNYYHAARMFCLFTDEKIWGIFYGEIFMNLELNSKRTTEISKILYKTYSEAITWSSDTSASVSFCKSATISLDNLLAGGEFKLPFSMIYETVMTLQIPLAKHTMNIATLNQIRTGFINSYFESKHNESYPNAVLEYQKKVLDAGHFEAYNYWLFMKGNDKEYGDWRTANKKKWDDFVNWFEANRLELNQVNRFHRTLY